MIPGQMLLSMTTVVRVIEKKNMNNLNLGVQEVKHVAAFSSVWLVLCRSGADANQKPANTRPMTGRKTTTYRTAAVKQYISATSVRAPIICIQTRALASPSSICTFRKTITVQRRMYTRSLGTLRH